MEGKHQLAKLILLVNTKNQLVMHEYTTMFYGIKVKVYRPNPIDDKWSVQINPPYGGFYNVFMSWDTVWDFAAERAQYTQKKLADKEIKKMLKERKPQNQASI